MVGGTVTIVEVRLCVDRFFLLLSLWLRSLGWVAVPEGYILILSSAKVGLGCPADRPESILATVESEENCKYEEYCPHGLLQVYGSCDHVVVRVVHLHLRRSLTADVRLGIEDCRWGW